MRGEEVKRNLTPPVLPLLTAEVISIGIGGSLTAPPLPHHRTYGSRIRRFGSVSIICCQGVHLQLSHATLEPCRACGARGQRILPFTTVRAFPPPTRRYYAFC